MSMKREGCSYTCSIYSERPDACKGYPWNFTNTIFAECIFVDEKVSPMRLRPLDEQLTMNTEKEISDYCMSCGRCCFFGPAACAKLNINLSDDPDSQPKEHTVFNIVDRLDRVGHSNDES